MSEIEEPGQQPRRRRRTRRGGRGGVSRVLGRVRDALSGWTPSSIALGGLALVSWGAPMLIGSIFGWAVVAAAGTAVLVTLLALLSSRRGGTSIGWHPVLLLFALATGWTALQLVPLPPAWLAALDPTHADVTARALAPFGIDRSGEWRAFSLDPAGTRIEILKGVTYGLVAFASALYAAAHGTRRLLALGALGSLAMAVVALAHWAVGATSVFGLYRPVYPVASPLLAPLLNPNHLAGFLALGVPLQLGFAVDSEDSRNRLAWYGAAAVTAAATVLTLSRGGIAALVAGALLVATLLWLRRRARADEVDGPGAEARRSTVVGLLVLLAGLVAAAIYVGLDSALRGAVGSRDTTKLVLVERAWRWALEHWAFGAGRGSFAGAFWRVAPAPGSVTFTHAEHLPAQWAAEWGIPAAALFGLVLVLAALRTLRPMPRHARELGAVAGLAALVLQNMVDFSLEIAGVTIVTCVLVGALVGKARLAAAGRRTDPSDRGRLYWLKLGVPVAAGVVVALLAREAIAHDRYRSLPALTARARDPRARVATLRAELREALLAHPADPAPVLVGAALAMRDVRDPAALRWLSRAMELAPGSAAPHRMAARFLRAGGRREQALLEYREAVRRLGDGGGEVVSEVASSYRDAASVLRVVPGGAAEEKLLEVASEALAPAPDERAKVDARLLAVAPSHGEALARAVERLLDRGEAGPAVELARRFVRTSPESARARVLLAQGLVASGEASEAIGLLSRDPMSADAPDLVFGELARLYVRDRQLDPMRRTLRAMLEQAGSDPERRARTLALLGELEDELGNHAHALRAYERAHTAAGDDDARWLPSIGRLAESLGDRGRALAAYRRLADLEADDPRWRAAVERLRPR